MSQTYMIALDPTLDLSTEQFIAAWNENTSTQQTGQLSQPKGTPATFADPNFAVLLLQTAVTVAATVLATQINELIKDYFNKKAKAKQVPQSNGSPLIIIIKDES